MGAGGAASLQRRRARTAVLLSNFGSNPFGGGGFGGGNTNPFGGGSTGGFGQQTSSTGSLFGQPQANQAQMGGGFSGTSIFGQPQQQQSTPNIFSTPKPAGVSSGAFGGVGQSGSIFGSPVGGNAFSPFGTKPPSMSGRYSKTNQKLKMPYPKMRDTEMGGKGSVNVGVRLALALSLP
eukprot:1371363-Amorphochlora_amoeboformis.AAC.1